MAKYKVDHLNEGFLVENPLGKVKVANPKPRVIEPYMYHEIAKILAVCDQGYGHNANFLGSRNKAIVPSRDRIEGQRILVTDPEKLRGMTQIYDKSHMG